MCIAPLYGYLRYRYFVKPSVYDVSELILKDENMDKLDHEISLDTQQEDEILNSF